MEKFKGFFGKYCAVIISAVCSFALGCFTGAYVFVPKNAPTGGVFAQGMSASEPPFILSGADEELTYETPKTEAYIIGIYDGHVAVFFNDMTVKQVTDKPTSALSPNDFARLTEGIRVSSEAELYNALQDYDS
ncbi:hypothetical protein FACS189490_08680 [Clostridia bacterium]|nr:hypothetical protein FACS189490_08680 [Clostridia bacterium]